MPENDTVHVGAGLQAGPEQRLHVDHDSAVRREPPVVADEPGNGIRDKAAGLHQDSRERVAESVEGARQWAGDRYDAARDQVSASVGQARDTLSDAAGRGSARLARQRSRMEVFVAENPALVGVVGLAAGLLVGALLPRTAQEDRTVGPYADEARDQGLRLAREAMHSGRVYMEAAIGQANEALNQAEERSGASAGRDPVGREDLGGLRTGPSGRYQNH